MSPVSAHLLWSSCALSRPLFMDNKVLDGAIVAAFLLSTLDDRLLLPQEPFHILPSTNSEGKYIT